MDSEDRRRLLPVLSRRWAGLLQGPGPAWKEVTIDTDDDFPDEAAPNPVAMAAWFSRRAGSVRKLCVSGSLPKLPSSLLATVLGTQASSLRVLKLSAAAVSQISGGDLAVLVVLTALEDLTIEKSRELSVSWDDHGAAFMKTLAQLPALQRLKCSEPQNWVRAARPTVSQLPAFRSSTLSHMSFSVASSPVGTLVLGALPELISCQMDWDVSMGDVLYVTPASFSGAPSLARLQFWDHAQLHLAPDCFGGLSRLAEITLHNCGLTVVPEALQEVQDSLRRLNLSFNPKLQIDQRGFNILLALPVLKYLNLRKPSWDEADGPAIEGILGFTPGLWTHKSICFLVNFLSSWQKLRSAVPPLLYV